MTDDSELETQRANAEATAAEAAAEDAADEAGDDDASSSTIEQNGVKYVRLGALHEARTKLKETRKTNKELAAKAQKYDTVAPYLGLLATHPEITRRSGGRVDNPTPPPTPQPNPNAEFDEVITSLGIDPEAGRKLVALTSAVARREARAAAAPAAATANATAAQIARDRAYRATDQQGQPFATRAAIDEVFSRIPDYMLSNDEAIKVALFQARGMGGPGQFTPEPLHTEDVNRRGGSRSSANQPLTDMERRLMTSSGMTEKDYAELSRQDNLILE